METTKVLYETGACIDGPESGLGVATAEERALWAHFERTRNATDRCAIAKQLAPLINERMGTSEWFMPINSRPEVEAEVEAALAATMPASEDLWKPLDERTLYDSGAFRLIAVPDDPAGLCWQLVIQDYRPEDPATPMDEREKVLCAVPNEHGLAMLRAALEFVEIATDDYERHAAYAAEERRLNAARDREASP